MDQRHSKLYTEEAASEGIRLSQLQFSARNKLQQADFDREFRSVLCLELVRIAAATLCSELAENVQKVALVGSVTFSSSWHLFWDLT